MRNKLVVIGGFLLIAMFIYGLVDLMLLRFEAGDVYPPYSSLRTDPLGAKAFYESIRTCCGLSVSRNYDSFSKLKDNSDAVILVLGVSYEDLGSIPRTMLDDLNYFIRSGGRLVLTVYPVQKVTEIQEIEKQLELSTDEDSASLEEEWGFRMNHEPLSRAEGKGKAVLKTADIQDQTPLSCYTSLYFDRLPAWRVIYSRGIHPMIIERKMGKGTVVLSSISYFLSNEAMLRERHSELLGWLIGSKREVIFDELYHGVSSDRGVAYLVRKYNLQSFIAGILVLAGLFVWKNASSLVPSSESYRSSTSDIAAGKESAAGLTNLLRRSIPAKSIFRVCYQEWRKSIGAQSTLLKTKLNRIQTIADQQSDPLTAYNAVSKIVNERE